MPTAANRCVEVSAYQHASCANTAQNTLILVSSEVPSCVACLASSLVWGGVAPPTASLVANPWVPEANRRSQLFRSSVSAINRLCPAARRRFCEERDKKHQRDDVDLQGPAQVVPLRKHAANRRLARC